MPAPRLVPTCFRTLSVAGTLAFTCALPAQTPTPRTEHTAVWTGTEMIVWGGRGSNGVVQTGARYNPHTHTWTTLNVAGAPSARQNHTAVWTGSAMAVWGGFDYASGTYFNDGACYNPATDTWTAMPNPGNPSPRANHSAVWTGSQHIVWGGASNSVSLGEIYLASGASYLPALNSWASNVTNDSPNPRVGHTAIWTGSHMVVWGGVDDDGVNDPDKANTGGRYHAATDTWSSTDTNSAPTNRTEHTAVWTGSQMIVWGGLGNGAYDYLNNGGRYDPVADAWLPTATTGAPSIRQLHTAVWTGTQMIVWGGRAAANFRNNGGRYNPGTDSWTATTTSGAPAPRAGHTAVWTGTEMIVFGGETGPGVFSSTLGRYHPALNVWTIPAVCALTAPVNNSQTVAHEARTLTATASDPDGAVTQVAFFLDGAPLATDSAAPYSVVWASPPLGFHVLTAVATDNTGLNTTSAPVTLEAVLKPKLSITATLTNSLIELTGGETSRVYRLEFSTDLAAWLPLATNVATNGTLQIIDLILPAVNQRFYRALP